MIKLAEKSEAIPRSTSNNGNKLEVHALHDEQEKGKWRKQDKKSATSGTIGKHLNKEKSQAMDRLIE